MQKKHKILIIDDDDNLLLMFKLKFEKEGFIVFTCSNGLDALVKAPKVNPDVILLDIMMPEMNGFETLHAFKNVTKKNSLIIMFTNLDKKPENVKKALSMGAVDYLLKSEFTPTQIVSRVQNLITKVNN